MLETTLALILMYIFFLHAFWGPMWTQKPAAYIQDNKQMGNQCKIDKNKQISHLCYCCCSVALFTCRMDREPVCLYPSSLPNRPFFVFPSNHLNTTKAEDRWASWIQGLHTHVAAARPQPSLTERTTTAGPALGVPRPGTLCQSHSAVTCYCSNGFFCLKAVVNCQVVFISSLRK